MDNNFSKMEFTLPCGKGKMNKKWQAQYGSQEGLLVMSPIEDGM